MARLSLSSTTQPALATLAVQALEPATPPVSPVSPRKAPGSWTKVDGAWCVLAPAGALPGQAISVARRNGTTAEVTVGVALMAVYSVPRSS